MVHVRHAGDPPTRGAAKDGYQCKSCRSCQGTFKTNAFWRLVCYRCQPDWFFNHGHGPAPRKWTK